MGNDQPAIPTCEHCDAPMRLIRTIPTLVGCSPLFVFHCERCNYVETIDWRSVGSNLKTYREKADKCRCQAEQTRDPALKDRWLELSEEWRQMAERR
jgi:hypothetical protein